MKERDRQTDRERETERDRDRDRERDRETERYQFRILNNLSRCYLRLQHRSEFQKIRNIFEKFYFPPMNCLNSNDPIYPTPPLGQDMTQGQFLSGVKQV